MKIFVLTPSADILLTPNLMAKLNRAGDVKLFKRIVPLGKVLGLFEGKDERILAIDPDFCNWKVSNKTIEKIPNLKAIVLQTTSFSWVDTRFCRERERGIIVVNLPGYQKEAVSEWAVMMAFLVARKAPVFIRDGWNMDYTRHQGMELSGKVAGVIGLGKIGTAMAEKFFGLGMKVQYWSRKTRDKRFEYVTLDKLMGSSDLILPAVAKNEETKGLITDQMIKTMKKTAIFISVVHEVYNHELLVKMISDDKIYGYAFESGKPVLINTRAIFGQVQNWLGAPGKI